MKSKMSSLAAWFGRPLAVVGSAPNWWRIGMPARSDSPEPLTRGNPLERCLRDGTSVRLRLMDERDRERLRVGFDHLSAESRYRRFFTPVPRLTEGMLRRLTETDGHDHIAIGAERGGFVIGVREGLGVARFFRSKDQPDSAEFAIAVIDEMQGKGLGRLLMQALCWVAREHGVRRLRGHVLPANSAMKNLILDIDPDADLHVEDGLEIFDIAVPEIDLERIGRTSSQGIGSLALEAVTSALQSRMPLFGRPPDRRAAGRPETSETSAASGEKAESAEAERRDAGHEEAEGARGDVSGGDLAQAKPRSKRDETDA